MIELPHQSYVAWRTCVTIFHAVAILSAVLRIATRCRSRRMWLDDYLVVVPMAADFVYCISPWALPSLTPDPRTTNSSLESTWATLLLIFIIFWFSRMCFMLSLARIFPPGNPNRRLIISILYGFALLFCSAVLLLAFHCDPYNSTQRHCVNVVPFGPGTIYIFSTDALGDVILIITPLAVLRNVKLPKLEKRVILAALSGGIVTLLLYAILIFITFGPFLRQSLSWIIVEHTLPNLAAATALLSCNALVVVTNIYRIYRRRVVRVEEAIGGPKTTSDEASSPAELGLTTPSAPAFDLGQTAEFDPRHRSRGLVSYDPNLNSTFDGPTGSEGFATPLSMYILTQISMDDCDSRYGPPDSTHSQHTCESELPVSSARAAAPGIH